MVNGLGLRQRIEYYVFTVSHCAVLYRDTMTRVMSLPIKTVMEYKAHNISLKDKSSYRNTDVFVR